MVIDLHLSDQLGSLSLFYFFNFCASHNKKGGLFCANHHFKVHGHLGGTRIVEI